ncbi:MAG: AMP-binding protein [Candidatus Omnitrophica bacterium]|nr:AMP-binding protein [Candidatus Omnitrophota bacterium]
MNIANLVKENAKQFPKKPVIIFQDQPISFEQLKDRVFKLANGLANLGVKPQDRVGIYLPNWPEYIYSYLALFCLGATVVPLDYMLTKEEMTTCLNHCEAKFVIVKAKDITVLEQLKFDVKTLKSTILFGEEKAGFTNFNSLMNNADAEFMTRDIKDDDLSLILYTSGTTGKPKGIMLTHKHLSASVMATDHIVHWTSDDIIACTIPFSHVAGLMSPLISSRHAVKLILTERFIPLRFLQSVQKYKATCFYLVPSMYYAILHLKEFEIFNLSSIRFINVFGAPNTPEVLRRFHKYCSNASFLNGWGLTETNGPCAITFMGEEKLESVGKPVPWAEIKIVDEDGKELCKGQVGEIIVRSWIVMKGYYKDEEETRKAIRDGWLYTGDLGKVDEDGYLYIVGRKKEMIKVSGELVYATEVESVIAKHPQIKEVAVVGMPDKLRGEVVKAVVSLKENAVLGQEDIRYFAKQHLAHSKVPHTVEFRDNLPKTRSGKVDKTQLK